MARFDTVAPTLIRPRAAAIRGATVVWGFAILLADIAAALSGRADLLLSAPLSVPLFVSGTVLTFFLTRLRVKSAQLPAWFSWPLMLAAILAVAAGQSLFDLYYYRWLALEWLPEWQAWALNLSLQRMATTGLLYLWLFGLAFTLLWALGVYDTARINAVRASASEAAALRLQLNPHFMVNTLNAIAGLIATGRHAEAEGMTCRLADFLRASLTADPTARVPLGDEIAMVEAYLEIEQVRSGDRLNVELTMPDEIADAAVPSFILQPLVENAVKFGVAPHRQGVTVAIDCAVEEGRLRLRVENQADGAAILPEAGAPWPRSTGLGLANVSRRLALDYGGAASLLTEKMKDGYRAEIRLPFEQARAEG